MQKKCAQITVFELLLIIIFEQMATVLRFVAHQEQLKIPDAVLKQIIEDANGNMRKAILVMEALRMQS